MDCYKMHSCFLQSPPNDSHLLTVLCIRPKRRRWGEANGNEGEVSKHEIYLLPFLRFFKEVEISFWNSMSVSIHSLQSASWLAKGVNEENGKPIFLIIFWNLRVVGNKTCRGLTRKNTDNDKISLTLIQTHTYIGWLLSFWASEYLMLIGLYLVCCPLYAELDSFPILILFPVFFLILSSPKHQENYSSHFIYNVPTQIFSIIFITLVSELV